MVKKSYSVSLDADMVESLIEKSKEQETLDEKAGRKPKKFSLSAYLQELMDDQLPDYDGESDDDDSDGDIPVYGDEYGEDVIAVVNYNDNLDFWDGNNRSSGSTGRHKGLTRLETGEYILIHGTQWQGESDTAEIISAKRALKEILSSGNTQLLDLEKFAELKALKKTALKKEM